MRFLKLVSVLALVLALAGTAGAAGIPLTPSNYSGPIFAHLNNFAMGSIYTGNINGVGPAFNGTNWYNPATAAYDLAASPFYDASTLNKLGPTGGVAGEDGWGIFRIDAVYAGEILGPNNIGIIPENTLYNIATSNKEIVGLYHDRQDRLVRFNTTNFADTTIQFVGDNVEVYVQPKGTALWTSGVNLGSSGRLAADKYAWIGYDAAGNPLGTAEKVWTMGLEPGFFEDSTIGGRADFVSFGTTGTGTADIFYSLTGGTDFARFDSNWFKAGLVQPGRTNLADVRLHITDAPVTQVGKFDWLVSSSDPLTAIIPIPEPLTMIGVFLGVGGLAGYIRRRKMA